MCLSGQFTMVCRCEQVRTGTLVNALERNKDIMTGILVGRYWPPPSYRWFPCQIQNNWKWSGTCQNCTWNVMFLSAMAFLDDTWRSGLIYGSKPSSPKWREDAWWMFNDGWCLQVVKLVNGTKLLQVHDWLDEIWCDTLALGQVASVVKIPNMRTWIVVKLFAYPMLGSFAFDALAAAATQVFSKDLPDLTAVLPNTQLASNPIHWSTTGNRINRRSNRPILRYPHGIMHKWWHSMVPITVIKLIQDDANQYHQRIVRGSAASPIVSKLHHEAIRIPHSYRMASTGWQYLCL